MSRTLVIETAGPACSTALFDGDGLVAERHEIVGRGHAERLIPQIAELPERGRADAILVDIGPGSFTGVRVGIAAAKGLAIGWGVPASGYSSLALLASAHRGAALAVAMPGGHGQLFVQRFAGSPIAAMSELLSITPDEAERMFGRAMIARDAATLRAPDAMRLPSTLRSLTPSPLYGREPDAKPLPSTAGERAAAA